MHSNASRASSRLADDGRTEDGRDLGGSVGGTVVDDDRPEARAEATEHGRQRLGLIQGRENYVALDHRASSPREPIERSTPGAVPAPAGRPRSHARSRRTRGASRPRRRRKDDGRPYVSALDGREGREIGSVHFAKGSPPSSRGSSGFHAGNLRGGRAGEAYVFRNSLPQAARQGAAAGTIAAGSVDPEPRFAPSPSVAQPASPAPPR